MAMLAVSAIWAVPAHAQEDQVRRGPAPDWVTPSELMSVPADAGGMVFVRRQDTVVHLDDKGQWQYSGYRIRLLHPNALQAGNLSLSWNPESGPPVVHVIQVHRDGQTIDILKNAKFDILRREDQLEAAQLNGVLTAVLRVPDLRVGDELEVSLTIPAQDPTLGNNNAGMLFLAPHPPAGRFHMELSWNKDQRPDIKMTPDMEKIAQSGARAVSFRMDNPPMLTPPKNAPARYQWQRIIEYSDFTDWASISKRFAPLYVKAAHIAEDSPLTREISRIAAAHTRPIDRASAALKLVQQDVRYIYVGLDGGNLTPASAEETWQRRYGDCKGKSALLLGLLAGLGIEAEIILANNSGADDGLDARLPNPGMFDHVLVRATIDGTTYYLDGTLPPVAAPSVAPILPYRWVLPLRATDTSIERVTWQTPAQPDEMSLYDIDAREGFSKPARITHTMIVRGLKGLEQQVQLSGLTQGQMLEGLRQQMTSDFWQSIDDVQWRYDQKARASVLTIKGAGMVYWEDDGDGARSLSLPGGGFSPPEKRMRPADQDQELPYANDPGFSCHVTTVRLPTSTQSRHWSFNTQYDQRLFGRNYYRAFELRDGAIRMIRGSRIEQQEIEAAAARKDNARIADFDNSKASIRYNPDRQKPQTPSQAKVPTTDEIDWTADRVPCLSPTTMG